MGSGRESSGQGTTVSCPDGLLVAPAFTDTPARGAGPPPATRVRPGTALGAGPDLLRHGSTVVASEAAARHRQEALVRPRTERVRAKKRGRRRGPSRCRRGGSRVVPAGIGFGRP